MSGLVSPPRAESPPPAVQVTPSSPKKSPINLVTELSGNKTPPASGASTPTANDAQLRKSFLGLPSLGFLRSRYPSTSGRQATEPASEAAEENGEASPGIHEGSESCESAVGEGDEEEDRKTIRGVALDTTADGGHDGKATIRDGRAINTNDRQGTAEKLSDDILPLPPENQPPLVRGVS